MNDAEKKSIIENLQKSIDSERKDPLPDMGNEYGRFIDARIAFESYSDDEMEILRKYQAERDEQVEKEKQEFVAEKKLEKKLQEKYKETHSTRQGTKWHSGI
ncbi:MAG: hypothetical protein DUD27_07235 [Lachnospiraceae bacterium]|uniref:Uncharacterized protein n=1 Tax=Candidatus Weimeria bifida TaxID=2599074 RepID=A0A6N7IWQ2_9FIRM|nr:hypothetical protein [Candidatus Weimeria bifida]RRF95771.1 MAG: hypothetical protein DUD27_07235 [Lachnospiraceae bacterium]